MKNSYIVALKVLLHLASFGPLGWLGYKWYREDLGANPIEVITHATGTWTLVFLLVTLAVAPLRKLPGLYWMIRLRRMLGLYAFFYGVLHLTTYAWLDQFFDWPAILKDIAKRKFITVGFASLALMLPLALTSTKAAVRWMKGRNWQRLHRLIYLSAILGVVHFWWLVKADITEPAIYGAILALLLAYRVAAKFWPRKSHRVGEKAGVTAGT